MAPKGTACIDLLASALEDPGPGLPEPVRELGEPLYEQVTGLNVMIPELENELSACAREDEDSARLMTIPGVGPITAIVLLAFATPMESFRRGRDFSAWLGTALAHDGWKASAGQGNEDGPARFQTAVDHWRRNGSTSRRT